MTTANDPRGLSQRGKRLVDTPPASGYLREHFARSASESYIPLCVAENKLVGGLIAPALGRAREVPESVLGYDRMIGSLAFRSKLARFMGRSFLGRTFAPEDLAVLAGAGSVLELLFAVIADPGDGVLVPTPSYAGFWPDLETRDELRLVPVHCPPSDGFRLTTQRLDEALASAGCRVRALLFTSPDNPTGRVFGAPELQALVDWTRARDIHLVMDELYALSVFGERSFVSAASLGPLGQNVHIVWAFSKDFAASGLRTGVLVSENEAVLAGVDALAYWACCSGLTQHVLGELIADDAWVDGYVAEMRSRLKNAYLEVSSALAAEGLDFLPSDAGFFLLLDLRRFLAEPSWNAEDALWRRLLDETNVNLTPGSACRIVEPGFMRLCFAAVPTERALEAVKRLGRALRPA